MSLVEGSRDVAWRGRWVGDIRARLQRLSFDAEGRPPAPRPITPYCSCHLCSAEWDACSQRGREVRPYRWGVSGADECCASVRSAMRSERGRRARWRMMQRRISPAALSVARASLDVGLGLGVVEHGRHWAFLELRTPPANSRRRRGRDGPPNIGLELPTRSTSRHISRFSGVFWLVASRPCCWGFDACAVEDQSAAKCPSSSAGARGVDEGCQSSAVRRVEGVTDVEPRASAFR